MYNTNIKELVQGKEYVFGFYSDRLGFVPTQCNSGTCRLVVEKAGRKFVSVRLKSGSIDKNYDGEGFFEIDVAKKLYRESLEKREASWASKGVEGLGKARVNELVEQL